MLETMRTDHGAAIVRRAQPGDAAAIATVHVAAWQWAYSGKFPAERLAALDTERRTEGWRRILTDRLADVWVATNPHIVGFAATARNVGADDYAGYAELESIYLLRSAQGVGVGRALMTELMLDLRDDDVPGAFLWVANGNILATRFYERAGWHDDGARRDIEVLGDQPVTVARFVIDLTSPGDHG